MKRFLSIILLVSLCLSVLAQADDIYSGDVNHDGKITIADVEQLIRIILKQTDKEKIIIKDGTIKFVKETDAIDTLSYERAFVDLGLPSGTKWAMCNLGAAEPQEIGYKYAWGEIEPKDEGTWENYLFKGADYDKYTKYYFPVKTHGVVDSLSTLELDDDAARQNWGGDWRMPTQRELEELRYSCDWEVESRNQTLGLLGTSIKDSTKTIFIPFAGRMENDTVYGRVADPLHDVSPSFYLWASNLYGSVNPYCADFQNRSLNPWDVNRKHWGQTVRPVLPSDGNCNGHRGVDLGLSSGLVWATMNVGAEKEDDYGSFFAWGETSPKVSYSWDNYKYAGPIIDGVETFTKYVIDETWGNLPDSLQFLDSTDDAATQTLGAEWSMPTVKQLVELMEHTTAKMVNNGVELTSKINGEKIFFPFTFTPILEDLSNSYVFLWTNELTTDYSSHANLISLRYPYDIYMGWYGMNRREELFPIRPVYSGN